MIESSSSASQKRLKHIAELSHSAGFEYTVSLTISILQIIEKYEEDVSMVWK